MAHIAKVFQSWPPFQGAHKKRTLFLITFFVVNGTIFYSAPQMCRLAFELLFSLSTLWLFNNLGLKDGTGWAILIKRHSGWGFQGKGRTQETWDPTYTNYSVSVGGVFPSSPLSATVATSGIAVTSGILISGCFCRKSIWQMASNMPVCKQSVTIVATISVIDGWSYSIDGWSYSLVAWIITQSYIPLFIIVQYVPLLDCINKLSQV